MGRRRWIVFATAVLLIALLAGCGGDMSTFRSVNVQSALTDMHNAAQKFNRDNGYWPGSVESLEKAGYLDVDDKIKRQWIFYLGTDDIIAESTDDMPDGPGQEIVYNFRENRFSGYGVKDNSQWR